jgi:hypothetical protein
MPKSMRRRCLGLIRPYLDETAHLGSLEMERHAHCSTQHPPVATDTRGDKWAVRRSLLERMRFDSQAPGSEDCTSERC